MKVNCGTVRSRGLDRVVKFLKYTEETPCFLRFVVIVVGKFMSLQRVHCNGQCAFIVVSKDRLPTGYRAVAIKCA